VFVGRLRKKLDPDGSLNLISTQRGLGYRFNLDKQ
ncbi:MAG TPA: winged helix-turn-helix domain-containing protein, partial [Cellvibrio sp.]